MPTFYDLMKYARTGIASPDMTAYDKLRALTIVGGAAQRGCWRHDSDRERAERADR